MDTNEEEDTDTVAPTQFERTYARATPFGRWLLDHLRDAGMSQMALSTRTGLSRAAINSWIRGEFLPNRESCLTLATALGVEPTEALARAGHIQMIDSERAALIELVRFLPESRLEDARRFLRFLMQDEAQR